MLFLVAQLLFQSLFPSQRKRARDSGLAVGSHLFTSFAAFVSCDCPGCLGFAFLVFSVDPYEAVMTWGKKRKRQKEKESEKGGNHWKLERLSKS